MSTYQSASPRRLHRRLLWGCGLVACALLACSLLAGLARHWTNIHALERRLQVTPQVTGGMTTVTNVAWYGNGIGWLPRFYPNAILYFDLELHNQDAQSLELVSTEAIAFDTWGRTVSGGIHQYGPPAPNLRVLLYPDETRPVRAGGLRLPLPLTWQRVELRITLKPAEPDALQNVTRWYDFTVESERTDPDGSYHLVGHTEQAERRNGGDEGFPKAIVSFYNAQGEFVKGGEWFLSGGDKLDIDFEPGELPRGPVTRAHVFYIEAYGPPIEWP